MSAKDTRIRVLIKQAENKGQFYCACLLNNTIVDYTDVRILNGILRHCSFLCSPPKTENCKQWPMGFWIIYYQSEDSFDRNKTKANNEGFPFHQDILLANKYPVDKVIYKDLQGLGSESSFLDTYVDDSDKYIDYDYYKGEYGDFMQPIIHIANIVHYHEELDKSGSLWNRSYNIMDNSIWNYLIPISPQNKIPANDFIWAFEEKFRSIVDNYNKGLYYLAVAYEFADLNARLSKDAYLSSAGHLFPQKGGDHASAVAPFIFHSEKDVEYNLIEKEFLHLRNTTEQILTNKWRILLVDDKAESHMSSVCDNLSRKSRSPKSWNCKLTIIKELIEEQFGCDMVGFRPAICDDDTKIITSENLNQKGVKILIEYAENIVDAEHALRKKKYDIILLDYLLRPKKEDAPNEYGYMLLENIVRTVNLREQFTDIRTKVLDDESYDKIWFDINNNRKYEELKDCIQKKLPNLQSQNDLIKVLASVNSIIEKDEVKIGPSGRNFFIFISAYSTAVYERLLSEGLNRSEKYWNIAVGACPTNTPKLFLYNLIKLMEKRLDDSGVLKLSDKSIYNIVNKIFNRKANHNSERTSIRSKAMMYYQEVLDLHYYYRKMLRDVHFPLDGEIFNTEGSVLITNYIGKNVNLGGLLEHLTQLVHLTAFGTVRQWPEMWEEYIYFKSQFNINHFQEHCESLGLNSEDANRLFNQLCVDIEDHILELKSDIE